MDYRSERLINLAQHYEGIWGSVDICSSTILNLSLDGAEWSASCPCHFTLPGQQPMAGLDVMEKKKKSPAPIGIESQLLGHPAQSLVTIPTELF
jgi:hypothetical protein